jgi:DNA polymerase III epsilon subunit-like protein
MVQLAALIPATSNSFEKNILPGKPIHPKAVEITQLYSTGCKLFYKGKHMKTEPVKDILNSFIDWLSNDALLVAHNCKKFDTNIIVSHYQNHDLINKLKENVTGFSDTLPLFQQKIPNLRSYSQILLATEILRQTYDAHNAKEDVTLLQ